MQKKLQELKTRLMEVYDLEHVGALLGWDEATYMPPGGAASRGRQSALLGRLAHEKSIDPQIGKLLDALRPYEESLPYDSDDASLIRVARRDFERSIKVPPQFIAEIYEHFSKSYNTWVKARPDNNFKALDTPAGKRRRSFQTFVRFLPRLRAHCRSLDRFCRLWHESHHPAHAFRPSAP